MEWLITWGVTEAAGALIYSIMKDLAQESGKDYVKEFFKNSLTNVLRLPEKDAQKEAYGKAIKVFLELFTEELERAGLTDEEINLYKQPLKTFIDDPDVSIILGDAFVTNAPMLDSSTLTQIWNGLNLGDLPPQFNWEMVEKFYLKKVKEIIFTSEKLKEIFIVERIDTISENIREISGIKTDFDLEKYAEGLKKQYGNLKLECLDTTAYEKIKLWQIFVPQKIKECFDPPQLYEFPKERLQDERFKKRDYPGGITFECLKTEVFGTHWADSSWREVLLLLTGMLSADFKEITDELISYLLDQNGETEGYSNIFLAADCFSELRNRAVHGEVSERLLESLKSLAESDRVGERRGEYFLEKVVSKIATIWQDDPKGWEILKLIAREGNYWYGGKQAVTQLSNIAQKNSQVLPILQEVAGQGESSAIEALAQYWLFRIWY